jgi:hypothetical protein
MKKIINLIMAMCMVFAFASTASASTAAIGSVKATASFSYTQPTLTTYNCYGYGSAVEQVASPSNTVNLYADTVVASTDGEVLAEDEVLDHYVLAVYTSCSTGSFSPTADTGYYTSTLARARYSDDSVSQKIASTTPKVFVISVKSFEEVDTEDGKATFIPRENFLFSQETSKSANLPEYWETVSYIYGEHFMAAGVGDFLPDGIYVTNDGSSCYVIDKHADGTQVKTTYKILGSGAQDYEVISTEEVA